METPVNDTAATHNSTLYLLACIVHASLQPEAITTTNTAHEPR
jgi:hypothetical protein